MDDANLPNRKQPLVMPELGMGNQQLVASCWLVKAGSQVTLGDRLLEVLAGSVTVDLPAPVSGRLVRLLVAEDDVLAVGQTLAWIEEE